MRLHYRLPAALLVIIFCFVVVISPMASLQARSLDDIQDDINQQKGDLSDIEKQLATANKQLAGLTSSFNSANGQIPKLEAEIKKISAEIKSNNLMLKVLKETEKLKSLEKEEREKHQDIAINHSYRIWKATNRITANLAGTGSHPVKTKMYQAQVIAVEQSGIDLLGEEILNIIADISDFESETASLEEQTKELEAKKKQLEAQLAYLRSGINSTGSQVQGLRSNAAVLQAKIDQLSAEQKALLDYEAWLLGQDGNGGSQPIDAGEFYFTGKGRELYTGHGVGMSQFGAYGLAQNGWNATQILKHYYSGVSVGQYNASQEITIKYCKNNPVYAAYQNNCVAGGVNYGPAVTERVSLDSYLAGLGEMPGSWPLEARKAQMIAARTYALRYTNNGNPNNPICLTTYCQVSYIKSGDQAEMDAVSQTKDLVITYNGNLIEALYSADNNNGWGTANNDTVFSTISGNGTPYPYLRAVQDNQSLVSVYPTYGHTWGWRTNSYKMEQFDAMLAFAQNDGYLYASSRNYIASIRSSIGQVASINLEKDPSGRVKKVILTGTTGASMPMAGWFFKTVWNSWVDQVQPTGQKDFMYSLTFFFLQG